MSVIIQILDNMEESRSSVFMALVEIEKFAVANKCSQFSDDKARNRFLSEYANTLYGKLVEASRAKACATDLREITKQWSVELGCAAIRGYVIARQSSVRPVLPKRVLFDSKNVPGLKQYKAIETAFNASGLTPYAIEPGHHVKADTLLKTLFVYCEEGIYEFEAPVGFSLVMES